MAVFSEARGTVAVLVMRNGPSNRLGAADGHLLDLMHAVRAAEAADACDAIVVTGAGEFFSGGADIRGAGNEHTAAMLRQAIGLIESCTTAVIMAINGAAFGGGLELALAGHFRLAHEDAGFRLHEVSLGVLPGAGGTQRLPRLIGARHALDMMLSGRTVHADEALSLGLVDHVVDSDVVTAALATAGRGEGSLRRTGSLPPPTDLAEAVRAARLALRPGCSPARDAIIDSVAQITDDLDAGLTFEASKFDELLASATRSR